MTVYVTLLTSLVNDNVTLRKYFMADDVKMTNTFKIDALTIKMPVRQNIKKYLGHNAVSFIMNSGMRLSSLHVRCDH